MTMHDRQPTDDIEWMIENAPAERLERLLADLWRLETPIVPTHAGPERNQ